MGRLAECAAQVVARAGRQPNCTPGVAVPRYRPLVEIEEELPPFWFGQEVCVLGATAGIAGTGVVRGVSRPGPGEPWAFAVELDGEADLVGAAAERLVATGWFRDDEGRRATVEQHEREASSRPGERLRRRHVSLRTHVEAGGADEAAARARAVVAALGLEPVDVDEPVEYWKVPGTWVVVTGLAWPQVASDDAEAAVLHLVASTGLDWAPVSGTPAGCDAVWNPGDAVDPRTRHVTWMVLDAIA
ncbi:hypothetical protein OERS_00560 [Oerskovia enterophila]|uniref:Uncharacterized protein n=1 Tax=Oerskovia enterophila TaxID=43678 RepID=A0ABX2YGB3_9CELL|nr:hypothetical protein OERS_00560 [Oerskovia enterophila]